MFRFLTITSLLTEHNLDGCDLLQVDTEGHDCRIAQAAIQAGLRPAIIDYEFIHTIRATGRDANGS